MDFFLLLWYLKLKFVCNNYGTKILKNGHSAALQRSRSRFLKGNKIGHPTEGAAGALLQRQTLYRTDANSHSISTILCTYYSFCIHTYYVHTYTHARPNFSIAKDSSLEKETNFTSIFCIIKCLIFNKIFSGILQ